MTPDVPGGVTAAHLIGTLGMFGVILFVQIVHYPLMAKVGREDSAAYAKAHTDRTGFVVAPLMLMELAAALLIWMDPPASAPALTASAGLLALAGIWLVTFMVSVPCHSRLLHGFDEPTHRRLVRSNWIRTVLWGVRVPIALLLIPKYLSP